MTLSYKWPSVMYVHSKQESALYVYIEELQQEMCVF